MIVNSSVLEKVLLLFGFSTRRLGHVMFSFAGNPQEAVAGGRSGAADIPVRGSLMGRDQDFW